MTASIFAVVVLSMARYISLAKPLEHRRSRSLGRAMKLMSFAYAIPVILWFVYAHLFINDYRQLADGECIKSIAFPPWISLSSTLIAYWIPLLLIVIFNLKSFCVIRKSRRQIGTRFNETNEAQSVKPAGS